MQSIIERFIFTAWMGPGPMSEDRESALLSIFKNSGVLTALITKENLSNWIHPDFPLHPAFPYLSAVHQCDYLRCYVLHVYGGGYTDIKHTNRDWNELFSKLKNSNSFGMGYTEIGPHGIAQVGGKLEIEMKENFSKIIGVCAMLFKSQTTFTQEWYQEINTLLDDKLNVLISNPARHPQDRYGASFTDGSISNYPFRWTEVGGDIFHPLAYKYYQSILHDDMAPSFVGYR